MGWLLFLFLAMGQTTGTAAAACTYYVVAPDWAPSGFGQHVRVYTGGRPQVDFQNALAAARAYVASTGGPVGFEWSLVAACPEGSTPTLVSRQVYKGQA